MPALSGPPPKPRDQIRHRVKPAQEWVEVENKPYLGPYPKLPAEARNWPKEALRWWQVTRRAPIAALWDDNDWQQVIYTVRVYALSWWGGKPPHISELRRRETELGLSWHARRAMRIRYVEPVEPDEEPEEGKVVDITAYLRTI